MANPRNHPVVRGESDSVSDNDVIVSSTKRQRRILFSTPPQHPIHEDADTALLGTSQQPSSSSLADLPPELLLGIFENVAAADLLDLRHLSKSYRDVIDTHVFYDHIIRAELVGYLGHRGSSELFAGISQREYWNFALVRARFDCLDEREEGQAKWDPQGASFRIEQAWFDNLEEIGGQIDPDNPWWDHALDCLDMHSAYQAFGQLSWCLKVGDAALELSFQDKLVQPFDLELLEDYGRIFVRITDWKLMLRTFFKEERALNKLMADTVDSNYTHSHREDCLRSMRRQRLKAILDPNDPVGRSLICVIDNMRALFGGPSTHIVYSNSQEMALYEQAAVQTIMFLRREAAMSNREHRELQQIEQMRAEMRNEMLDLDSTFKTWQEHLLAMPVPSFARLKFENEDEDGSNPMMWSDEKLAKERDILRRWKGHRQMIQQITSTIAELPDDALNDNDF